MGIVTAFDQDSCEYLVHFVTHFVEDSEERYDESELRPLERIKPVPELLCARITSGCVEFYVHCHRNVTWVLSSLHSPHQAEPGREASEVATEKV